MRNNGAIIDSNGYSVNIAQPLVHSTVVGDNAIDGGLTKTGTGTLTLDGVNTYTGATTITNGTLNLGTTGSIDTTSGVTINGSNAKFLYNNSTAFAPTVTVNNGAIDGTGTVNTVIVPVSGNLVNAGNGAGGTLQIGSLTFNGAGTVAFNPTDQLIPGINVTGALTTNAAGTVVVNASSQTWNSGYYNLISYAGSIGGAGFSAFQKGTVTGLNDSRQSASLVLNPTMPAILPYISRVNFPYWTGAVSSNWTTAILAGSKNWTTSTQTTDFQTGDTVIFADSVSTNYSGIPGIVYPNPTVDILDADVVPKSAIFSNNTLTYTVNGPYGITGTGNVLVNGTGTVTFNSANSYSGGTQVSSGTLNLASANTTTGATTVNGGTLNINNAAALGTGALTINGGTIDNTTSGAIALTTTNAINLNGAFAFGGTNELNFGTQNAVTLTANSTITNNGSASLVVPGVIGGTGFSIAKSGTGNMVISGTNTYDGSTIIHGGTLEVSGGTTGTTAANIQISPRLRRHRHPQGVRRRGECRPRDYRRKQ